MATANTSERREPEFLQLHGGDHPGMVLVSAPLDGTDFLAWKRSVVIALRAKMKLGFIDGRDLKDQKRKDGTQTRGFNVMARDGGENVTEFGEAMKQVTEFLKLMKGQLPATTTDPLQINFAQGEDFAGIGVSRDSFINDFGSWIIDTGATKHMCADSSLFTHTDTLINKSLAHLPDGSSQPVKLTGDDQRIKAILAVGKVLGGLYIIDNSSFDSSIIEYHFVPIAISNSLHCTMSNSTIEVPCLPNPVPDFLPSSSPTILPPTQSTDLTPSPPASSSPISTLRRSHRQHVPPYWLQDFVKASPKKHDSEMSSSSQAVVVILCSICVHWYTQILIGGHSACTLEGGYGSSCGQGVYSIEGVDYYDSFAPVAKTVTVRLFIAIATAYCWPILQLDVNNTLLHSHLDEEVYMTPPKGYEKAHPGLVCKLKESLYGLKQASSQWNIDLTSKLEAYGFKQSPHDHCLFTMRSDSCFLALIVYVDDVLLTSTSIDALVVVKTYLDDLFTIKDIRHAKYFLGLELARSSHGAYVTQHKYLQYIVHDCHLQDMKAAATPLSPGLKLDADSGALLESPDRYRGLIGRLLYLGFSHPDISFAVQQLSQYIQHPHQPHCDAASLTPLFEGVFSSWSFLSRWFLISAFCIFRFRLGLLN
ncbi:UNVERIFIED_CONTAM: Retrovirus-related Pol polyprotein from transposon RE1 [Sesamum calycinum]|uniref:Retrovirus-related Pol polyprotein from transposon RE1 n=1 Tax=Sesamum calycinum TaxID=2727403 RepID=A0AAW2QVB7_9LAMI